MQIITENIWILSRQQTTDWSTFIQFWETIYNYSSSSDAYDKYVVNRPVNFILTDSHIRELYQWKNNTGETLAAPKAASVEKNIVAHIDVIQQLAVTWDDDTFVQYFGEMRTIWQTFLMHIIQPDLFPIFDQHVYRAYAYLQWGEVSELKGTVKHQIALYETYQRFFKEIQSTSQCPPRSLDKAFWAFGKFIKQYKSI